jgi:hypothetical protein
VGGAVGVGSDVGVGWAVGDGSAVGADVGRIVTRGISVGVGAGVTVARAQAFRVTSASSAQISRADT